MRENGMTVDVMSFNVTMTADVIRFNMRDSIMVANLIIFRAAISTCEPNKVSVANEQLLSLWIAGSILNKEDEMKTMDDISLKSSEMRSDPMQASQRVRRVG